MPRTKRTTIYLEEPLYETLRLKATETSATISDLVNTAVRQSLAEDADDLDSFRTREREPRRAFKSVVRDLKRRGKR